jgi:hypothetical protein
LAYATIDDVETLMPSLSGTAAAAAAEALLAAASDFVDGYVGRSWVAGTVTGEVQIVRCGQIQLDRYPISGVTTIVIGPAYIGAQPRTLVANSTYQILDLTRGIVLVSASDDDRATVTYTAAPGTVPDDIKQATAMLAAYWARPAVDSSGMIFSKIKAGSAELTYREQNETLLMPMDIKAILSGHRQPVVVA